MLSKSQPAFLSIPNAANKRILHEGRVSSLEGQQVTIEFEEQLAPSTGAEVMLFAEIKNKFFQQGAKIVSVTPEASKVVIVFETSGDPVSAEQRGSFRTSVVAWKVPVRVDSNVGCMLADVSPEGIGVITPKPLTVGTTVEVHLEIEGIKLSGQLRVQTAKILPNGKLRFGLFVPDRRSNMRPVLQKLNSFAQRVQLKRLSGAA